MSCPRKNMHPGGTDQSVWGLRPNPIKLTSVVCKPGGKTVLQRLAIEERVSCSDVGSCPHNFNADSASIECYIDHKKYAHLYVAADNSQASFKHYVIVFVDMKMFVDDDSLVATICNTVEALKIAHERPFVYICCFGNQPAADLIVPYIAPRINKGLRNASERYDYDACCTLMSKGKGVTTFTITPNRLYGFNCS